jgi:F-type H+-transporting ATPase subunit b
MRIDWWTLLLQTINALVLIWLLAYFLFRPVAEIVARRKAQAARLLDDAERAKADAAALREQADAALIDAQAGRADTMRAAAAEAQTQKEALIAAARAEIERLRAAAQTEMERATETERRAANARAASLALEIARRLFERLPPDARVLGFVGGLANAVARLPAASRDDFGQPGQPARLAAPRALTAAEEAETRDALARAFGRPLELIVAIDPALIAGLELENRHTAVRNSFRADLARIAAELAQHDRNGA